MNVSISTPKATANPISARKTIGSTPRTANVEARTMPAEVMTPPVTERPRSTPDLRAELQRLLPHPGHQEDVVVDPQRDQEDEREERERRVGAGEVEDVVEEDRADAQCRRERQHDGGDQQQRSQDRPQQDHQHDQDHHQDQRDDHPAVPGRRVEGVQLDRGLTADLGAGAGDRVHGRAQRLDRVVRPGCRTTR